MAGKNRRVFLSRHGRKSSCADVAKPVSVIGEVGENAGSARIGTGGSPVERQVGNRLLRWSRCCSSGSTMTASASLKVLIQGDWDCRCHACFKNGGGGAGVAWLRSGSSGSSWRSGKRCKLVDRAGDTIELNVRQNCPLLTEAQALNLVSKLEDMRLRNLEKTTAEKEPNTSGSLTLEEGWFRKMLKYMESGKAEDGQRAIARHCRGLPLPGHPSSGGRPWWPGDGLQRRNDVGPAQEAWMLEQIRKALLEAKAVVSMRKGPCSGCKGTATSSCPLTSRTVWTSGVERCGRCV